MRVIVFFVFIFLNIFIKAQTLYFPPNNSFTTWQTQSPSSLGWCQPRIDSLYNFLQINNTKGFIVLKDGNIVLEKYFGTFTQDSLWYWASAGKSLTAVLTGLAQSDGVININNATSSYIGNGWTSCSLAQEQAITIANLLTMTSGLNDAVTDNNCDLPPCLQYLVPSGTRWAYHTGAYSVLHNVLSSATSQTMNTYTNQKIWNKIGGQGVWYNGVMFSRTRDAARFGLLMLARGNWAGTTVINDNQYFNDMINSSQNLNRSYGYLWWLNGKQSFMVPGLQTVFNFNLIPSAPSDMYCALGKNNQKIYVIPSTNMVVVRFGNETNGSLAVSQFDEQLWQKINQLNCSNVGMQEVNNSYFNISKKSNTIQIESSSEKIEQVLVFDANGKVIISEKGNETAVNIDISNYVSGIYFVRVISKNHAQSCTVFQD